MRPARALRCRLLISIVVLTGCGSGAPGTTDAFAVRDSAGVQVATNHGPGAWPADSVWRPTVAATIGGSADPHDDWGWVHTAAVDSRGEVLLLGDQRVFVYDSTGSYVRTIGGPGQGPGELGPARSMASAVMVIPGDSVIVADMGNMRINAYAPDGTPAWSFPIPLEFGGPASFGWLPGQGVVMRTRAQLRPDSGGPPPVSILIGLGSNGATRDTVMPLPDADPLDLRQGPAVPIRMLQPRFAIAIRDGTILTGKGDRYELRVHDASGRLTRIIRRDEPRRPVSAEERRRVLAPMQRGLDQAIANARDSQMAAGMQKQRDGMTVEDHWPAFGPLAIGPEGRLLAGLPSEFPDPDVADPPPVVERWDVFSPEGRYLGVLELPAGFHLLLATDHDLYVIGDNAEGRQVVERLVL